MTEIPDGGAMAQRILMLSTGLVSRGHEVQVIVPYRFVPGPLAEELDGVKVHWGASVQRPVANSWLAKLRKRYLLVKVARQLAQQGLDWIILYGLGMDGLPFLPLARRYGVSLASDICDQPSFSDAKVTITDLFLIISWKFGHWLVTPKLQLNIAISRYLKNILTRVAPEVPVVIIPAPVDTRKYKTHRRAAQKFREKIGLGNSIVLGYFGSTWGVKGLTVFLEAAAQLRRQGKEFRLLITGDLSQNRGILKLLEDLHLMDWAILPGFLPKSELLTVMSAADILIEPKIVHVANEAAFPQKLAEYLALGKAIVASAVGDIPRFLTHGQNALLCQAGDPAALAQEIETLIDNAELRQKLGLQARETAVHYFDSTILAKQLESAFYEVGEKQN